MRVFPYFKVKFPAASFKIWMTPSKDPGDYLDECRKIVEQERIYAYYEVVNYLLNF